jgi:hypothetical protein
MKIKFLTAVSLFFMMFSCSQSSSDDNTQLSSDLVNNPNSAQANADTSMLPKMTFDHLNFDFGLIFQGEQVVHKFKFKNTGKTDLLISNVSATCGCTIPSYSRKPIKPGDSGYIEVKFDSEGRHGQQHKSVIVLANTQPNRIELTFTAEIEKQK